MRSNAISWWRKNSFGNPFEIIINARVNTRKSRKGTAYSSTDHAYCNVMAFVLNHQRSTAISLHIRFKIKQSFNYRSNKITLQESFPPSSYPAHMDVSEMANAFLPSSSHCLHFSLAKIGTSTFLNLVACRPPEKWINELKIFAMRNYKWLMNEANRSCRVPIRRLWPLLRWKYFCPDPANKSASPYHSKRPLALNWSRRCRRPLCSSMDRKKGDWRFDWFDTLAPCPTNYFRWNRRRDSKRRWFEIA